MKTTARTWAGIAALVAGAAFTAPLTATTALAASGGGAPALTAHKIGTAQIGAGSATGGELRPPSADDIATSTQAVRNRSPRSRAKSTRTTFGPSGVTGTSVTAGAGTQQTSVLGINHYDQRYADGGNQYSLTPPDQALCASGTQVVEAVNNAIRIYNPAGGPLSGVTALNPFFGFSHEINRSTGVASAHQIGDPSCVYDASTQRFFLTVYDLSADSSGNPTGPSAIDVAVSPAAGALGKWTVYSFDTSDQGGTSCPCFSDYPHLATDATALYVSTNEFPTLAAGFNGAQVFALPKAALAAGDSAIPLAHVSTATDGAGGGFTLSPVVSSGGVYPPSGKMYFLSSDAVFEDSGASRILKLWTLTGTGSIGTQHPSVTLTHQDLTVPKYAVPPLTQQPDGAAPLRDCLNVTACAKIVLGHPNRYKEALESYDSSDTRVMQTAFADGLVWGALDTAVDVAGSTKPGIAYYAIRPGSTPTVVNAQTLALPGGSLSYPAIGVTAAGKGVIAMSLAGGSGAHHPSAAYAVVGTSGVPTSVNIAGEGQGAYDDFSGYRAFQYNRPRFGDYGAASVVGGKVYLASEYIEASCGLSAYESSPFGTCGRTRTTLANWATRISAVTP